VGAGPGDPDLLTVRAVSLLKGADVVLHDALVSPQVLALISPSARVLNVGKRCGRRTISQEEINELLVRFASEGNSVVRLKSGDPLIFGRAGEELDALRRAEIEAHIVPGVTAALAAAAAAQISLTDRRVAEQLLVISAHRGHGKLEEWDSLRLVSAKTTVVVYMPGDCEEISERLLEAGMTSSTPCMIVSQVSTSGEQSYRTKLGELRDAPSLPSPCILVVGETVASGDSRYLQKICSDYTALDQESLAPTAWSPAF
jgi:uroporphyrin-III C-methyltransferase